MRNAKCLENGLKAEVNIGKILESASQYKHAEARDRDLSNFLFAVQKSVAHFEGGREGA